MKCDLKSCDREDTAECRECGCFTCGGHRCECPDCGTILCMLCFALGDHICQEQEKTFQSIGRHIIQPFFKQEEN